VECEKGGTPLHSRLSEMNPDRTRIVKRVCWLLLIVTCVFHVWSDGRNATRMNELQRQGQTLDSARQQIHWLCAPLNIATLTVLVSIAAFSIKWKRGG
jgi:hypothetical protein